MLAPDWLLQSRPGWLRALTANQRRLVTVRELHRAMRLLASYPDTPPGGHDPAAAPSLFDEVPEKRTCKQAGVPDVYCACRNVPQ